MPGFAESAVCLAPAEEVWALLYDPTRFPEWWEGTEHSEPSAEGATRFLSGQPGVPVPTRVRGDRQASRVVISCLVTDVVWRWTLERADAGCHVRLDVELGEGELHFLESLRTDMAVSMRRLVAAAERSAGQ